VCRARLSFRFRMEGLPEYGRDLRHSVTRRIARKRSAARAYLHAGIQSRNRPRRKHLLRSRRANGGPADRGALAGPDAAHIYAAAASHAESRGIILADTKFEFGWHGGQLLLADEVLTPDSSRYWPRDDYRPGGPQKSFDKQFVRDYLETLDWNKQPPAPPLPEDVIEKTSEKYHEAYRRITGRPL